MSPIDRVPADGAGEEASAAAGGPAEEAAALFVKEKLEGREPDLEEYAARLADERERERFRALVHAALQVDDLLPRQPREGLLISGRYRILRPLGEGGMGRVFAARDERLDREVALKALHSASVGRIDLAALFERESRLHAALDHPNIVPIHEAGSDGDIRYLVMELVDGLSLRDLLERLRECGGGGDARAPRRAADLRQALGLDVPAGRRDLIDGGTYFEAVARIVADLARTLEAAHAAGIVHRDLKPGNIMLRADGSPVVLDFGLAGLREGKPGDVTLQLFGSAAYLAPEQAVSGCVGRDPRSDIYQLGLVLYELLTLRRAFPGKEMTRILDDIGRGRFERPRRLDRRVPVALEAICLKAMELDPRRRYARAADLAEDLERFLEGDRAPVAMGGGRLRLWLRDARYAARRRRRSLQAAAFLLAGLALAWFVRPGGAASSPTDEWRPFVVAGWDAKAPSARFDPTAIAPGEVLGVRAAFEEPRWLYAYALYARKGDLESLVCPLLPEVIEGDVIERSRFGVRIGAGPVFAALSEAEPDSAYESVVFFAAPERQPLLEAWLSLLPGDGDVPLAAAERILEAVGREKVAPLVRGVKVPPEISRERVKREVRRLGRSESSGRESYPFQSVEWNRLFRLPVRPAGPGSE